jgi:hypothetical protein
MKQTCKLLSGLALCFLVFTLLTMHDAFGSPGGITGRTLKGPSPGCTCHGSQSTSVSVVLKAPSSLAVNQAAQCTVTVSGTQTGVDIAASSGVLAVVSANLKKVTSNGELTHTAATNPGTFIFTYTAHSTAGTQTLYATGVPSFSSGIWNHATNKQITITPATAVGDEHGIPRTFGLSQNFPNPFNPSTRIEFEVGSFVRTSLKVYNLIGEEVATLVNEDLPAGRYERTFNASSLPSGVYIYRLDAGAYKETRKLLLLK